MTWPEFQTEYMALAHAIQSCEAWQIEAGSTSGSPKHLRTGIDTQKADFGGLSRLLIAKGIITEEEYQDALLDGLKRELDFQKARARELGASDKWDWA